jgi:hypothetical protein
MSTRCVSISDSIDSQVRRDEFFVLGLKIQQDTLHQRYFFGKTPGNLALVPFSRRWLEVLRDGRSTRMVGQTRRNLRVRLSAL